MRHLYTTPFCAIRIDSAFVAATHSNSRSWQQQQELKLLLELQLQLQFPEKSYRAAYECESERDDSIAANYSKINTRLICKSCIHFCASILCSGSLALCGLLCVCVCVCMQFACPRALWFLIYRQTSGQRGRQGPRHCGRHVSATEAPAFTVNARESEAIMAISFFSQFFHRLFHSQSVSVPLLMLSCISFNGRHCCCWHTCNGRRQLVIIIIMTSINVDAV